MAVRLETREAARVGLVAVDREGLVAAAARMGDVVGAAAERVAAVLSRSTRDRLDEFVRDRLGVPPELCNLPILV